VAAAVAVAVSTLLPTAQVSAPPTVATALLARGAASVRIHDELRQGAVVSTGSDGVVALDWNGSLRLAASTRVRMLGRDAIALERGTIYFSSTQSGVEVRTPHGVVRDVGTQFEVQVGRDVLRVRVREGLVDLERRGTKTRAAAGTELSLEPDGAVARRPIPRGGPEWAWVTAAAPAMRIDGNAHDLLAAIAREKGVMLMFRSQSLDQATRRQLLHGGMMLPPDDALAATATAAGLRYKLTDEALVIER
ncbi:MAG TPA: FecR domain-containing protein, partial [Thermoanaerobaculia bacterium]|nr:FecR domain-containing protein [Thermoanaerobaculia bacterium]